MAQLYQEWVLFSALIAFSIGVSLTMTHLPALLSIYTKKEKAGQVMGIYDSTGSLSRIIGPLVTYFIFYDYLQTGYFWFGIALIGIALFVMISIQNKPSS